VASPGPVSAAIVAAAQPTPPGRFAGGLPLVYALCRIMERAGRQAPSWAPTRGKCPGG